jgi:hypothetical protein
MVSVYYIAHVTGSYWSPCEQSASRDGRAVDGVGSGGDLILATEGLIVSNLNRDNKIYPVKCRPALSRQKLYEYS